MVYKNLVNGNCNLVNIHMICNTYYKLALTKINLLTTMKSHETLPNNYNPRYKPP